MRKAQLPRNRRARGVKRIAPNLHMLDMWHAERKRRQRARRFARVTAARVRRRNPIADFQGVRTSATMQAAPTDRFVAEKDPEREVASFANMARKEFDGLGN